MTPHQARPGVGGFKIDRVLGKFGRRCLSSGTTDPELYAAINGTISRLKKERRWDLLGLLVPPYRGSPALVTPLELHDALWRGAPLPTPESVLPLHRSVVRWLEGFDRAPRTKDEYERQLLGLGSESTKIGDLPELLLGERAKAIKQDQRPTFNRLLSAAATFLQQQLGRQHPLTLAVTNLERLRETRRAGNPQSVPEIVALAKALGSHGANLWALCLSGFRRAEYFGRRWKVNGPAIDVLGTKSQAAKRVVPLVYPISAPTCGADHFNHLLHDLTRGEVRIHDCRYTWMRWLETAGVPPARLRWYAGHKVVDVTEHYRRGRGFEEFLRADGQAVRDWLGDVQTIGLRVLA